MSDRRTNQGGSVVSFVIVGAILATLVGGGIYLINQRNKTNTGRQNPTGTNQPTQTPAESGLSDSSDTTETSTGGAASGDSSQTTSPQVSTPVTGVNLQDGAESHLPSTGPADTALQLLAAAVLIGVVVAYLRSYAQKYQPV